MSVLHSLSNKSLHLLHNLRHTNCCFRWQYHHHEKEVDRDKTCNSSFCKGAIEQSDVFRFLILFYRLVPLILVEGYGNCTDTCQICDDNIVFNRSKASIKPYILKDNYIEGIWILVSMLYTCNHHFVRWTKNDIYLYTWL